MKHYNSLTILLIDLQLKQKKFKDFSFLTHFTVSPSNIAEIKVQSLHVISDKLGHLFKKLKIDYTYFLIPLVISRSSMVSSIVALPQLHWVSHSIFSARKNIARAVFCKASVVVFTPKWRDFLLQEQAESNVKVWIWSQNIACENRDNGGLPTESLGFLDIFA